MNVKLESIASSAVKAADKVGASLIICLTHTGKTASMLARYRPPMPIMTLVVPYLKNEGLKWTLEGRSVARQALLTSGLLPVLAAPTPSAGESLLEEAIALAAGNGLVKPHDHVVAVSLSSHREAMVKIVSVSGDGMGIKKIRPASLIEMIKAASARHGIIPETPPQVEDRPAAPSPAPSPDATAAAPAPEVPAAAPAAAATQAAGARAIFNRLSRGSVIIGRKADPLVHFDE